MSNEIMIIIWGNKEKIESCEYNYSNWISVFIFDNHDISKILIKSIKCIFFLSKRKKGKKNVIIEGESVIIP